jgi:hypothetical protein
MIMRGIMRRIMNIEIIIIIIIIIMIMIVIKFVLLQRSSCAVLF